MTITEQTTWLIAIQNGQAGPFTVAQMREHWAGGKLNAQSYVWREGLANWQLLGELDDLRTISAAAAQPVAAVAAPAPAAAAAPESPAEAVDFQMNADDDYLDEVFVSLVKDSWTKHRRRELSTEVDEVLVGGVITGVLDNGYSLIDLTSNGTSHYLRFEDIKTGNRVIFQLDHLAENLLTSEVLGHQANISIGFGARVRDFAATFKAVRQELRGGYLTQADPGVITIDGDMTSQYIYVMVGMIWDINDYLNPEDPYQVLYPKLGRDIGATLHALRKYMRGRFGDVG